MKFKPNVRSRQRNDILIIEAVGGNAVFVPFEIKSVPSSAITSNLTDLTAVNNKARDSNVPSSLNKQEPPSGDIDKNTTKNTTASTNKSGDLNSVVVSPVLHNLELGPRTNIYSVSSGNTTATKLNNKGVDLSKMGTYGQIKSTQIPIASKTTTGIITAPDGIRNEPKSTSCGNRRASPSNNVSGKIAAVNVYDQGASFSQSDKNQPIVVQDSEAARNGRTREVIRCDNVDSALSSSGGISGKAGAGSKGPGPQHDGPFGSQGAAPRGGQTAAGWRYDVVEKATKAVVHVDAATGQYSSGSVENDAKYSTLVAPEGNRSGELDTSSSVATRDSVSTKAIARSAQEGRPSEREVSRDSGKREREIIEKNLVRNLMKNYETESRRRDEYSPS